MDPIRENWNLICENLKKEYDYTDISFNTWIKPLEYYETRDNTVYILIQSDQTMQYNYITNKFSDPFKVIISETIGDNFDVKFILKSDIEEIENFEINSKKNESAIISANLNPKYTFENFVVGSNNKFAYTACLAVAETPGDVYNPLYIYGNPGLGKTHLMHSIGHMIIDLDPSKKVIYVTSEEFTNEVVEAIRFGDAISMSKLRDKYRNVDVLMVDDIQFIIGKDKTQEEFFHTFNALHEAHKQIVISSDKPPRDIPDLEERFMTRFLWGLTVDINKPDYETRVAILRNNAEKLDVTISDEIIHYIATNFVSNIRELEGALNKVAAHAHLNKTSNPTIEIAEFALKDMINPEKSVITSKKIIDVVSEVYDVKADDILSSKRNAEFALPRQVVMYLCSDILSMNYTSIASLLNKKDHTTIIHGVKKIRDDLKNDDDLRNKLDAINKKLK